MSIGTAIWVGFMGGFITAWKLLPWIGEMMYRMKHRKEGPTHD